MANAAVSLAVALVVVAAIASSGLAAAHAGTDIISRTCRRTQDAALCVAVLTADPRSALADTVHGLAEIALDIAADSILENTRVINFLYIIYAWTPKGDATKVCRTAYVDAIKKKLADDAWDRFDDRDYAGASRLVESALVAGDRCEAAFKGVGTKSRAITLLNRQMMETCVVARGLIDVLASSCSFCSSCSRNF